MIGDVRCVGSESRLLECSWDEDNVVDDDMTECQNALAECYSSNYFTNKMVLLV